MQTAQLNKDITLLLDAQKIAQSGIHIASANKQALDSLKKDFICSGNTLDQIGELSRKLLMTTGRYKALCEELSSATNSNNAVGSPESNPERLRRLNATIDELAVEVIEVNNDLARAVARQRDYLEHAVKCGTYMNHINRAMRGESVIV